MCIRKSMKFMESFMAYRFIVGFIICILLMFDAEICFAREIFYGSETETVSVAYGGPTIFRFNEEVKTITQATRFKIESADKASPDYTTLSVTPRFLRGKSNVTFILANGAVVSAKLIIVSKALPEQVDSFYDFKPKDSLVENFDKDEKGTGISELELMKAMIRWEKIVGYNVRTLVRTVNTGIDHLSAKLIRVYTGPRYNGYVFRIRNLSKKKGYAIDLKSLALGKPNMALLSQVDQKILKPIKSKENTTFLRIVAKPASIYYNVNLPVARIKNK